MAAVDIGQVVYLQDAPQYRHMGIASNRLCMFLAMGVPVVANRQSSFQFIEDHGCGVLIDRADEFPVAIRTIADDLPAMKRRALECARTYIRAGERWTVLRNELARVLGR